MPRPDPPSPAGGIAHVAATENPPEERVNQTHEAPAAAPHSGKDAGDEPRVGGQVAMPNEKAISQSEMPVTMLLALAIVLMIAGMLLRRIISLTFARRRTVDLDRRDAVPTSMAIKSAMPKFLERHDLAPNSVDNDHLDDEVKEALRKLLRVLDKQAVWLTDELRLCGSTLAARIVAPKSLAPMRESMWAICSPRVTSSRNASTVSLKLRASV